MGRPAAQMPTNRADAPNHSPVRPRGAGRVRCQLTQDGALRRRAAAESVMRCGVRNTTGLLRMDVFGGSTLPQIICTGTAQRRGERAARNTPPVCTRMAHGLAGGRQADDDAHSGPAYDANSARVMLCAATHGVPPFA